MVSAMIQGNHVKVISINLFLFKLYGIFLRSHSISFGHYNGKYHLRFNTISSPKSLLG